MALSFSTLSYQYWFIISLKSTLSWFSRNLPYSIIVVLRSKQILFLHLMTTFVHKITHNKACIVLPCFRGFGWPGNPSPAETLVPNLRAPVVFFQLLGLPAGAVVRNKQQLGWFLRPESQVSSIFHFSVLFQQVAVGEDGKKCWGIRQLSSIQHLKQPPRHQLIRIQPLVPANGHQSLIPCPYYYGTQRSSLLIPQNSLSGITPT